MNEVINDGDESRVVRWNAVETSDCTKVRLGRLIKAQSTISPKIQRIELQVSLFNTEQGKVEAGITNLVFFNYPAKAKT